MKLFLLGVSLGAFLAEVVVWWVEWDGPDHYGFTSPTPLGLTLLCLMMVIIGLWVTLLALAIADE